MIHRQNPSNSYVFDGRHFLVQIQGGAVCSLRANQGVVPRAASVEPTDHRFPSQGSSRCMASTEPAEILLIFWPQPWLCQILACLEGYYLHVLSDPKPRKGWLLGPSISNKGMFQYRSDSLLIAQIRRNYPWTSSTDLFFFFFPDVTERPESIPKILTNFVRFGGSFQRACLCFYSTFTHSCSNTTWTVHILPLSLWKKYRNSGKVWPGVKCFMQPHHLNPPIDQFQLQKDSVAKIQLWHFAHHQSTRQSLALGPNFSWTKMTTLFQSTDYVSENLSSRERAI